jgi:RNA polymerase sigma factor (sigma-70 family)
VKMGEPVQAEGTLTSEREHRFRLMFEAHYRAIHNYSIRRVDSDHDAADVTAEVFTTAWRRIDDVPRSPYELPWLYGVARRTISDLRRAQSRRASLVDRIRVSRPREVPPSSSDDSIHDRLLAAMAALPPDDCEALRLVLWDQLSHAEAALVMDCSVNAIGIRIHRAKKRLRASLPPGTISDPTGGTSQFPIDPLRS